jgi:hypothetical protein
LSGPERRQRFLRELLKPQRTKLPAGSLALAATRVVVLYDAWRKPAKVAEWRAKLGFAKLPADVFSH